MATKVGQQTVNVSFNQIFIAFAAIMVAAGAFVAIITNALVGSRVGALESAVAQQYNPVTVTAAEQTNNAPEMPFCSVANTDTSAMSGNTNTTAVNPSSNSSMKHMYTPSHVKPVAFGHYSYNQSNTSTINTTSSNVFYDYRWSGNTMTRTFTDSSVNDSNNSFSSTNNNTQSWNNGNTTTTDSGNTTTTTNNQTWNQDNNSVNNSGNTTETTTTTNTTTNTATATSNSNTQSWNNGNTTTTDSGNTANTTTDSGNTTTTVTDLSNNSTNLIDNDGVDIF